MGVAGSARGSGNGLASGKWQVATVADGEAVFSNLHLASFAFRAAFETIERGFQLGIKGVPHGPQYGSFISV